MFQDYSQVLGPDLISFLMRFLRLRFLVGLTRVSFLPRCRGRTGGSGRGRGRGRGRERGRERGRGRGRGPGAGGCVRGL